MCSVKKTCNFIRKRLRYWKVFKNTYFEKRLWTTASENQHFGDKFWSSRPEVSCKKRVLINFAKFTGKPLCQSVSFLIKLQAWDSGRGVFLWILWNFEEHLFHGTPLVAASANVHLWFFFFFILLNLLVSQILLWRNRFWTIVPEANCPSTQF